ncbi:unnamed protein product [Phyllotreta striolata]|uniref:UDP-glucuronosyltransferase n=1 Tax=Phyllotreta striolata TaxID=444603 RepID=A0A9N9TZQ9_PHYSR|nr:unnamed protein product [Phyllotreta striolata]
MGALKVVALVAIFGVVNGSKILALFPSPGYSQYILAEKLMGSLAKRGHQVTVISEYEPSEKIDNFVTIKLDKSKDFHNTMDLALWDAKNSFEVTAEFLDISLYYGEVPLKQKQVQDLIKSNSTFDLVIVENFCNEAQLGFGEHFKAPVIVFSSQPMHEWNAHYVGNAKLPSISPNVFTQYTNHMSFFERLHTLLLTAFDILYKELVYFPEQQRFLDEYFPEKMDLRKVIRNVEMLLVFAHPLTTEPSLITSAVVEVGGFHIMPKKLPRGIQTILDGAKNGAILVSLGSNIPCHKLPKEQLDIFLRVFKKLPQRILWKCELDIPNTPNNVFLSKWVPQPDVLAHPNTVAFVTHNGLLSTTEAMYFGVPMISVPVFVDQKINAVRARKLGVAEKVDFINMKEEDFYEAIKKVTQNSNYTNQMKKLSQMFRDQPSSPLDRAINNIEYVLKYRPGKYLRSPALDLWWFQLYMVDVVIFILASAVAVCLLILFVIRKLVCKKKEIIKNKTD